MRSTSNLFPLLITCLTVNGSSSQGRGGEDLSLELSRALQRSLLGGPNGAGKSIALTRILVRGPNHGPLDQGAHGTPMCKSQASELSL